MVNRDRELERMQSVKLTKQFAEQEGRRPRILIAEMEEDGSKKRGNWPLPPLPTPAGTWT